MASIYQGPSGSGRPDRLAVATLGLLLAFLLSSCASLPGGDLYHGAPTLLAGTSPEMNTAGFWIGRHPEPDSLILDEAGVAELNRLIRELKGVRDLETMPIPTGEELRIKLRETTDWLAGLKVYQASGKKVDRKFLLPLVDLMNAKAIPIQIIPRYGFVTLRTDIRVLPTPEPLLDEPGDPYVDNLQASNLEPGTALVVLHQSADAAWLYAITEQAAGWLPARAAALVDLDVCMSRYRNKDTVTVIAAKADLFNDEGLTDFRTAVRMGTKLPLDETGDREASSGDRTRVLLCDRDDEGRYVETPVWVESDQVHRGNLPYTARTIYRQAFKLLNTPYGWGGLYGERDCSQFLCEVFSTVGIVLPRNSTWQSKVGVPVPGVSAEADDDLKIRSLDRSGLPAATILRLPGHIMLYLGMVDGRPYVLHSTLAYREKRGFGEVKRLVNRATVSNTDLGEGSSKGSLTRRLTIAATLTLPAGGETAP